MHNTRCSHNILLEQVKNYEQNLPDQDLSRIYSPNATQHAETERIGSTSKDKRLDQFVFFECFTSQSMTESMLVEFLHDIMKQATSRSVSAFRPITSVKLCLGKASGLSILLPITSNGIPVKDGLLRRSWSSLLAIAMFSRSAASTTYLQIQLFGNQ